MSNKNLAFVICEYLSIDEKEKSEMTHVLEGAERIPPMRETTSKYIPVFYIFFLLAYSGFQQKYHCQIYTRQNYSILYKMHFHYDLQHANTFHKA